MSQVNIDKVCKDKDVVKIQQKILTFDKDKALQEEEDKLFAGNFASSSSSGSSLPSSSSSSGITYPLGEKELKAYILGQGVKPKSKTSGLAMQPKPRVWGERLKGGDTEGIKNRLTVGNCKMQLVDDNKLSVTLPFSVSFNMIAFSKKGLEETEVKRKPIIKFSGTKEEKMYQALGDIDTTLEIVWMTLQHQVKMKLYGAQFPELDEACEGGVLKSGRANCQEIKEEVVYAIFPHIKWTEKKQYNASSNQLKEVKGFKKWMNRSANSPWQVELSTKKLEFTRVNNSIEISAALFVKSLTLINNGQNMKPIDEDEEAEASAATGAQEVAKSDYMMKMDELQKFCAVPDPKVNLHKAPTKKRSKKRKSHPVGEEDDQDATE